MEEEEAETEPEEEVLSVRADVIHADEIYFDGDGRKAKNLVRLSNGIRIDGDREKRLVNNESASNFESQNIYGDMKNPIYVSRLTQTEEENHIKVHFFLVVHPLSHIHIMHEPY